MSEELWPFKKIVVSLTCALVVFLLTLLCLESFTFILRQIGSDLHIPESQYSLISSIPTIFLGVGSFIYASLADFVKLKYLFWIGFVCLIAGSLFGFFFHAELWQLIVARSLQTFGGEVGGSVFLVITARYLSGRARVISYGIFTGGFQLGFGSGVFAGGAFSLFDWHYLFLFPLLALLVAPLAVWALPKGVAGQEGSAKDGGQVQEDKAQPRKASLSRRCPVDVVGFSLFVCFSAALLLFFSFWTWPCIAISAAALVAFGIYIFHAKDPFISPGFFKNGLWIGLTAVLFCFWLPNLSISTACNSFATYVFDLNSAKAALIMLAPIITAALVGVFSGPLVNKVGKKAAIILAGCLELGGFLFSAASQFASPAAASASLCLYYAGVSLMYSPLVDSIVSSVEKEEAGRGLGLVDLSINVSSSIGYALFVPLMAAASFSFFGQGSGEAGHFASIFYVFACCTTAALLLFLWFKKKVRA